MKIVLLLVLLLVILFMFSKNESFADESESECTTIKGECSSKLCPSNCKIQHSTIDDDKCYCVERK